MFQVGDRVRRIENREMTEATVITVDTSAECVELEYDEGGSGWWPLTIIEALP